MSMPGTSRRSRWIALGVAVTLLLLAAFGYGWWLTHEQVEEEVDLPRVGEITYNPLYVLGLALREDGWTVASRQRLQPDEVAMGRRDTVLLLNDPRRLSETDADALLDWVGGGGHLIMRTPPAGRFSPESRIPLLDTLGVTVQDDATGCVPLLVDGDDSHVEFCDGRRFDLDGDLPRQYWLDEDDRLVFARLPHGEGSVDVIADLDFLTNDKLRDGPHIALTRQLLAPNYKAGTAHLLYAAQMPSFWTWLLAHSWMAWLPLLLALLAWLWRRTQRFGPPLPAPASERRSLLEHIDASGEHVYRYGYAHLLHGAVRNAFLARLRRRDPQAAALEGEPQAALIAERFKLSPAEVRTALASPVARDHAAFRSRIALLIRMRNQL